MHILFAFFLLISTPVFAQSTEFLDLNGEENQPEMDYSALTEELTFIEESAAKADEKLLQNVDKISEEKTEANADLFDSVSTTSAAVEKTIPVITPPPAEKNRRIRSR